MEDVLEIYSRPPREDCPLVCLDKFAKQLLSKTRAPVAAIPGHLARDDYEYVREGSVSGFMIAMPHLGKRDGFVGDAARRWISPSISTIWLTPCCRKPRKSCW